MRASSERPVTRRPPLHEPALAINTERRLRAAAGESGPTVSMVNAATEPAHALMFERPETKQYGN